MDAIRELWVDYFSAYEEFEIETEEILDLGNGVVLAVNHRRPAWLTAPEGAADRVAQPRILR